MHLQASLFDQCGVPASVYHIWCMVRALRCLLSFASHLVGICAAFSTIWHCSCLYGSVRYCSAGWVAVCAVVGELPPGASALPNFCGAAYLQPIRPIARALVLSVLLACLYNVSQLSTQHWLACKTLFLVLSGCACRSHWTATRHRSCGTACQCKHHIFRCRIGYDNVCADIAVRFQRCSCSWSLCLLLQACNTSSPTCSNIATIRPCNFTPCSCERVVPSRRHAHR